MKCLVQVDVPMELLVTADCWTDARISAIQAAVKSLQSLRIPQKHPLNKGAERLKIDGVNYPVAWTEIIEEIT